ncbi:Mitochondrial porin voltage-dependent anion channel [Pyrenophora tritici-repentis]|uniref:Mitochondrial porin (Voltage-dependent anion channel) n=1 Tax=Pyrenophora tritici-repentis TaxID=45151 RepID=A0A2W1DBL9_9PLEO|nr:Porin eukaryotic type [Pyrenophora tritici-repentis]KAF7447680.1 Porin eukaryotic type [Pyrenophora tritici-repentis]KAF7571369.1 Mitochondrial porin (voltage-dependent anion channel) [Pyrenophora tritici-repentis]KAG9385394.1 Porin eukaryotic type [Pyrenophora tritici-repentis]KAI0575335.1 Porin eukaryotic type [Pyrenophora tritici-repentis]
MTEYVKVEKIVPKFPPPAFSDIAKASNDLINKDFYHTAAAALEVKLKAPNGVNFTAKGTSAHDGPVTSSLEGKKSLSNGISITQSWNTANLLATKVELNDTFASGLKTEVLSNFNPAAGNKGQKVNLHFKQPAFHGRAFVDYSAAGAIGTIADAVVSHEGMVVGGEVGYDVQKAAITKYSAAVGYTTPLYNAAVTATNSLSVFTASYYQRVNPAVEAGARAVWDSKSGNNVGLEIAAKYKLDPASFAKAKINNLGIASLAYNTKVNSGLTFGIGGSFDTQKLNEAGHKLGTSFTFEG